MNRIELPALMRYQRGSHFRGTITACDLIRTEWRRAEKQRARWRELIDATHAKRTKRATASA